LIRQSNLELELEELGEVLASRLLVADDNDVPVQLSGAG
jgi:hypothetical protein